MFDKHLIKNKTQKSNIFKHFFQKNKFKNKGYKMKFSSLALATTLALTFSGCVIDDALNSVTGTIDSITQPSETTNTSNRSDIPVKNFNSASELEKFCDNAPKRTQYIVTKLPNLVWDEYATYAKRELTVIGTKKKIILKARNSFSSATSRPLFKPDLMEIENGRMNSKYNVTFLEPLVIEKVGNNPMDCTIEYHRAK